MCLLLLIILCLRKNWQRVFHLFIKMILCFLWIISLDLFNEDDFVVDFLCCVCFLSLTHHLLLFVTFCSLGFLFYSLFLCKHKTVCCLKSSLSSTLHVTEGVALWTWPSPTCLLVPDHHPSLGSRAAILSFYKLPCILASLFSSHCIYSLTASCSSRLKFPLTPAHLWIPSSLQPPILNPIYIFKKQSLTPVWAFQVSSLCPTLRLT